jgi:5-methylcytosine-specific restriction endonuclease McrA
MKHCSKCGSSKDLSAFNKHKATINGLHRVCRACEAAMYKERYAKNRERIIQRVKEWQENNKERHAQTMKVWRNNNPDKVLAYRKRMYALAKAAEGSHTKQEWDDLKDKYGYKCLACGQVPDKLTQGHVVSRSIGGSDYIDNIQPLCRPCSSRKQQKIIDYRPVDGIQLF